MNQTTVARVVAALVAALAAGGAGASGFQSFGESASGLGNAYAGSAAVADDASTIFFNPAGMTRLKPYELSMGMIGTHSDFGFSNGHSQTGVLSGNGGDAGGWAALPSFYASVGITDKLFVGVGANRPFQLNTNYESPWYGEAQGNQFEIKTWNVNPSVAYKITDKISIGAGASYQKIDVHETLLLGVGPFPMTLPMGGTMMVPLNAFSSDYKASKGAWGWNVGGLFDISENMRMGISYRSAIKYTLDSDLAIRGQGPYAIFNDILSSSARAEFKTPDTAILSIAQTLDDRWDMYGDLSWTGWQRISSIDFVRTSGVMNGTTLGTLNTDFRNTWRVALGATYKYNDEWKFKYGVAYDQSPVRGQDSRLVGMPFGDQWWLSVGAQWAPVKSARIDVGLAYLYMHEVSINNDQSATGQGLVNGNYNANTYIFGVQYSQSF